MLMMMMIDDDNEMNEWTENKNIVFLVENIYWKLIKKKIKINWKKIKIN